MRVRSEKARRDIVANRQKVIDRLEQQHPHFLKWAMLLASLMGCRIPEIAERPRREWPEEFYRRVGAEKADWTLRGEPVWLMPGMSSWGFTTYLCAWRDLEQAALAPLGGPAPAPRPHPEDAQPLHEPMRKP